MSKLTDYNFIQQVLARNNFHFSKSMGQNFLTESWVVEQIAESAGLDENTTVVEVGPGIGCLTRELSQRAGRVVAYELDKSLMPVLAETLSGCENVEVVFRDFMKENDVFGDKFVANIPYNITSQLLTKVIQLPFNEITVMIQKEVAHRICATAGMADYSSFGIMCQWYTDPEILFDVSADCFTPRPKVTSSVIKMVKRDKPPVDVPNEKLLFDIIRASFNQRRKTLVNAVSSATKYEKVEIEHALETLGFDTRIRGEVLSIGDFAEISKVLQ